jgi:prolyl oligopeptidase
MRWPARLISCFALSLGPAAFPVLMVGQSLDYPPSRPDSTLDWYFGTSVPDPYRWLESLNSRETASWIAAQNALTAGYLDGLPQRDAIKARLTELWNYAKVTVPVRSAGRLFYRKNTGLQRQSVLYTRSSLGSPPRELLDPNKLSPDGSIAFADYSVSPDGRLLAYALAEGGSDFRQVHVRDLASGRALPDTVRWVKFSDIEWTRDGRGFFYARFPAPKPGEELSGSNRNQRVYYHVAGTGQEQDRLIYARPDHPDWFIVPVMSEDGRYLCVYTTKGVSKNRLFYADLESPRKPRIEAPIVPLLEDEQSEYIPLADGLRGAQTPDRGNAAARHRSGSLAHHRPGIGERPGRRPIGRRPNRGTPPGGRSESSIDLYDRRPPLGTDTTSRDRHRRWIRWPPRHAGAVLRLHVIPVAHDSLPL